jgi:hypothetical protein
MVMRAQETLKTELQLKRYNYRKICIIIKENKRTISFIYFIWETDVKDIWKKYAELWLTHIKLLFTKAKQNLVQILFDYLCTIY